MFDEGNTKSNRNVYSFRLRSKVDGKDVAPFFEVSTPDEEGKWNKLDKQIKNITGKLIQVKTKEDVWEGAPQRTFNIRLEDEEGLYLVNLGYTKLGRSLANSFLALQDLETPIQISVYVNKNSKTGASVRQNGEMIGWKFSGEDLPRPTSVTLRGQEVYDYSNVEVFLEQELNGFAEYNGLTESARKSTSKSTNKPQPEQDRNDTDIVEDEDDLF